MHECMCCKEIDEIVSLGMQMVFESEAAEAPLCITDHPRFLAVCKPDHKQLHHIAYRQIARWDWGLLGKEVRVVLPSCAVMHIRQHFPPPGLEENFTFEGFHDDDE